MIMDHGVIVAEGTPRDLKRQVSGDSVLLSVHDENGALSRAQQLISADPHVHEVTVDDDRLHLYLKTAAQRCPACSGCSTPSTSCSNRSACRSRPSTTSSCTRPGARFATPALPARRVRHEDIP